jgi:hypothetical protein
MGQSPASSIKIINGDTIQDHLNGIKIIYDTGPGGVIRCAHEVLTGLCRGEPARDYGYFLANQLGITDTSSRTSLGLRVLLFVFLVPLSCCAPQ